MNMKKKKYLFIFFVVLIVSVFYIFMKESQNTNSLANFDSLYKEFVSDKDKLTCKDIGFTCKEFYLGYALFKTNPKLSLKYLKNSYENNISSLVNDGSAQESYITGDIARVYANLGDYKNAIIYAKKSVEAGEPSSCELGRYYDKLDMLDEAKEAFEKSIQFYECKFELGTYYYNGRGVKQDKTKGAKLWSESYKDDKYGVDINYNMAVYHLNDTKDMKKYKYHLLKASNLGDKEAKYHLKAKLLKGVNASEIFIDEAVSKAFYYTPELDGYKFSYGFNLYYRFKEFYNKKGFWQENYDQKDAVEFEKNGTKIRFELQELNVKTNLKSSSIREFIRAVELTILSLHVDTSNIELYTYLADLEKKLQEKKDFELIKQIKDKYHFSWHVIYDNLSGSVEFLLKIEET